MEIRASVRSVLVERAADIRSGSTCPSRWTALACASTAGGAMGGVDIEEVARTRPEAIGESPSTPSSVCALTPHGLLSAVCSATPDLTASGPDSGQALFLFMDLDSSWSRSTPDRHGRGQVMALDTESTWMTTPSTAIRNWTRYAI